MKHVDAGTADPETKSTGSPTLSADRAIFARNGEYWSISYQATTFPLKDIKGLAYIQHLLQHPGEEIHALDLLNGPGAVAPLNPNAHLASVLSNVGVSVGGLGDAGEMLDARAKQAYKSRLFELREELEELRENGNPERAEEVQREIEFLAQEIARAVGMGGRNRRAGSAAERARLNVTRAIKAALQKISEQHAPLGELLERSIRTGSFCSYIRLPNSSLSWEFALEGVKAPVQPSSPEPFLIRRESSPQRALANKTAFVGRKAECAMLRRFLDQARRGEGRVAMVGGAPGVGKTRIATELASDAWQRGFLTFTGSCYDRDDSVPFIPFVEILEAALAQAPSQKAFRDALGHDAGEVARLLPQLRRLFPDIPRPLDLAPEQSRRVLFQAVLSLLGRAAAINPVLLVLEDLQWADEGTLSLLNYLARSIAKTAVLIIGTYRNTDVEGGLLSRTIEDLSRPGLVAQIDLYGLDQGAVAEMIRALSGHEPPEAAVAFIYAGTEGNPFFVEELFKHLAERGSLVDANGEFRHDLQLSEIDVPQSLRRVIERRLTRLGNDTRTVLGTAAVIGRSFTFDLLEVATGSDAESLIDRVEEAEKAGLISSSLDYPDARFQFSHELIRRYVLGELSSPRRQRLHLSVANALERIYPNALDDHANDLAHHLLQAGGAADRSKTTRYLEISAKRARMQGALTEAETFYRRALTVLATTPQTPARDQWELALQLALGALLMATEGYTGAGTSAAYKRAIALGERLGQPMQVVLALAGHTSLPLLRGELETANMLADQVLSAAQRDGSPKAQVWAYHLQGVIRYHRGDLALALQRLNLAREAYCEDDHRKNPQDPGSETLEYIALTAWQLGMADLARARIREARALNERLAKPYAAIHCQFYAAYLHVLMRDPKRAQQFSESVVKQSAESSIALYFDAGRILEGWALALQGRCREGFQYARDGLASFRAAGNRLALGSFLGFLAEAEACDGKIDEALATVEEALHAAPDQLVDMPYLLWLRGKMLLQKVEGDRGVVTAGSLQLAAVEQAEQSFRDAISLASRIGAKYFALRAATSIGRLLVPSGRTRELHQLLIPTLEGIEDGLDIPEVVEAKRLLLPPN